MAWFWQAWLAAVVFVFPIGHTVALRNLLLAIGLLVLLASIRQAVRPRMRPTLMPATLAFLATSAWLVFHSLAIAPVSSVALANLRGDWLVPLLTACLATFAAARVGSRSATRALVAALMAHMVWMLAWQLQLWLNTGMTGGWHAGAVPFDARDHHSSLNGFLFSLLLAERLASQTMDTNRVVFSNARGWAAFALALLSDGALRARNGTLVNALMLLGATSWIARSRSRFIFLLLLVLALGAASVAGDPRWAGLSESLDIGWNSKSLYWMNWDPAQKPQVPSGVELEESAYARAAWAHQAVTAIAQHPLGLGFGRDGFGRAVAERYGYPGLVSSHSGWLDFALGAGLPGLALLLLTAGLAIRGGWRQFRQHGDAAGLMFSFLVGGYLLRCLLDGHLSGWRLGLFAFICGVLIASMKKPAPAS